MVLLGWFWLGFFLGALTTVRDISRQEQQRILKEEIERGREDKK